MSNTDSDAEDLIAHLCGGLAPDDRESCRQAALASSAQCWGPSSLHSTLVPCGASTFTRRSTAVARPGIRRAGRASSTASLRSSHGRDRRRTRGIRIVL
jgi:hypothetical protein